MPESVNIHALQYNPDYTVKPAWVTGLFSTWLFVGIINSVKTPLFSGFFGFFMKKNDSSSTREAWVLCLILGTVMLNYPFLQIFNTDRQIAGIPLLVLYLVLGWPISIGIIFFFVQRLNKEHARKPPDGENSP